MKVARPYGLYQKLSWDCCEIHRNFCLKMGDKSLAKLFNLL